MISGSSSQLNYLYLNPCLRISFWKKPTNSRADAYAQIVVILEEMVKDESRVHHLKSYESSQEVQITLSQGTYKDFREESS